MFMLHEVNEGLEMLSFLFKLSTIELTVYIYMSGMAISPRAHMRTGTVLKPIGFLLLFGGDLIDPCCVWS